jgi:hypothetical protein
MRAVAMEALTTQNAMIQNAPTDTPTFTYFSKLPAEIRHMLWERIIPRRVISIQGIGRLATPNNWSLGMGTMRTDQGGPSEPLRLMLWGTLSPPAVLQVCQEAREVALKHYIQFERREGRQRGVAYVSPGYDTIFLYRHPSANIYWALEGLGQDLDRIESLAIDTRFSGSRCHASNVYTILRTRFPRLRELMFVLDSPTLCWLVKHAVVLEDQDLSSRELRLSDSKGLLTELSRDYQAPPDIVDEIMYRYRNRDEVRRLRTSFGNLRPTVPWKVCKGKLEVSGETACWICIRKA